MFENLISALKAEKRTIVFTEGEDARILEAASRLKKDGLMDSILVGNVEAVKAAAAKGGFDIEGMEIIDPATYPEMDAMVAKMVELRKGKMSEEDCRAALSKGNYFGTMLVKMGKADALLGGATYSTADTVRPALQLIKTKPGAHLVSSCFILVREKDGAEEKLAMGDCAINIDYPDSKDKEGNVTLKGSQKLAEVAIETANTAKAFGIDPKVAVLSFSTKGSGRCCYQVQGLSSCRPGQHLHLPVHRGRQHRLQDRSASGRLRSLRPDPAGSERSDQRSVPRLQRRRGLPDGDHHRRSEVISA